MTLDGSVSHYFFGGSSSAAQVISNEKKASCASERDSVSSILRTESLASLERLNLQQKELLRTQESKGKEANGLEASNEKGKWSRMKISQKEQGKPKSSHFKRNNRASTVLQENKKKLQTTEEMSMSFKKQRLSLQKSFSKSKENSSDSVCLSSRPLTKEHKETLKIESEIKRALKNHWGAFNGKENISIDSEGPSYQADSLKKKGILVPKEEINEMAKEAAEEIYKKLNPRAKLITRAY